MQLSLTGFLACAAASVCSLHATATELEFLRQGSSSTCGTLKCPPGINCEAYLKPMCEQCVGQQAGRFVIRCADAACSSFSGMRCEAQSVDCSEAKQNVEWVLLKDKGARNTFETARRSGQSPFDALLTAQGHNPRAQASIRQCRAWVQEYLAEADLGTPSTDAKPPGADTGSGPDNDFNLDCISVVSTAPAYDAAGRLWYVDLYTENRCTRRVRGTFCVAFGSRQYVSKALQYFRPGVAETVRVTDPRLLHETEADKQYRYLASQICMRDPPFSCHGSCN